LCRGNICAECADDGDSGGQQSLGKHFLHFISPRVVNMFQLPEPPLIG
jgi:hypothetical protein